MMMYFSQVVSATKDGRNRILWGEYCTHTHTLSLNSKHEFTQHKGTNHRCFSRIWYVKYSYLEVVSVVGP